MRLLPHQFRLLALFLIVGVSAHACVARVAAAAAVGGADAGRATTPAPAAPALLLAAPTLFGPSNGAGGVSTNPTFSWSSVTGADRYWVMVATSTSAFPTDPAAISCPNCVITGNTGANSYTVPNAFPFQGRTVTLSAGTTYFWKVQAYNTNGTQGAYPSAFSFTTASAAAVPTISSYSWNSTPVAGQLFGGSINGTNFISGIRVFFCVNGSATSCFEHPQAGVTLNSSTRVSVINVNLGAGSYQIYVQTSGGTSTRSTAFSVLLAAPSLSGPSNGATGVSTTPTFSWSGVSGASKYWVTVATSSGTLPTDPNTSSCPSCVISCNTTSTSLTASPTCSPGPGFNSTLSANTTYYWRVQGFNSNVTPIQQGVYSGINSFTTAGAALVDAAGFVSETIPDGSAKSAGEPFTKTWTVRNSGTTTWNSNYRLRWVSGASMSNHADVAVSGTVAPGASYTFSVPMTAPSTAGTYREDWKLINGAGATIPVSGSNTIWVSVNVSAAALGPPTPLLPGAAIEPGLGISTTTPTFQWTGVTGADGYGLYISKQDGAGSYNLVFDTEVYYGRPITGTTLQLPAGILVSGGQYRWNMRSHSGAGYGTTFSSRLWFSVGGAQTDAATFVSETVLDGTTEPAGQPFTKSWTIRNSGTSTWNSNYKLRWVSGAGLSNHADVAIAGTVVPGATYTFIVQMTAPSSAGTYREDWKFINGAGATIPVGSSQTVWVSINVGSVSGSDAAGFVGENVPDGSPMTAGQSFTKTWTVRNSGTTTWNSNYRLRWVSGASMSNHADVAVSGTVAPGASYTFSVPMTAPSTAGTYREDWKLINGAGATIPVSGSNTIWVSVRVADATAASDRADFVSENVPDGSPMPAGQPFTKTWTVRNGGTTTWNSNYRLRWVSGSNLSNHADAVVAGTVAPGATYTFSVPMTAPGATGTYREDWKFINGAGATIAVSGYNTIWVDVRVSVGGQSGLNGNVTSASGGVVSGASVQVAGKSAVTDALGNYNITGINAGDYTATVSRTGYATLSAPVSLPSSTQVRKDFRLQPNVSSVGITVTSISTKYGSRTYFLDGVSRSVTFTANVDWAGHPPGSISFITPKGTYIIPTSSGAASKTFDVGSEFGVCGRLKVSARSSDGAVSPEKLSSLVVMSKPPLYSVLQFFDTGDDFNYSDTTLSFKIGSLSKSVPGTSIPKSIPFFGEAGVSVDFDVSPSFTITRDGKATYALEFGVGRTRQTFSKGRIAGVDFDLDARVGVAGAFSDTACRWNWGGTVGLKADLFKKIGRWRIPQTLWIVYLDGGVGVRADTQLDVYEISPWTFGGSASVEPYTRFSAGGGFDLVGAVEGGGEVGGKFDLLPQLDLTFQGSGSYKIVSHIFGVEREHKVIKCSYSLRNGGGCEYLGLLGPVSGPGAMSESTSGGLRLYPRNYLGLPGYAALNTARAGKRVQEFSLSTTGLAVQTTVYPLSDPTISSAGGTLYSAWLSDDPARSALNRSVAVFSAWDGAAWGAPKPIADDGTGDFHPQILAFQDRSALAAWEDANAAMPDTSTLEQLMNSVEISASSFDPATGQWTRTQRLTANGYLDRSPLLAGQNSGDAMMVWIANEQGDVRGSAASPNKLWSAKWDGAAWGAPQFVASVPYGIVKYDLAYGGSKGGLVLTLDTDNDQSTDGDHELFGVRYQGGAWGALTRLTNDGLTDDNPRLAMDSKGNEVLVWIKGDEIYSAANGNIDARKLVAAPGYSTSVADFKLAKTPDGRVALMWAETGAQSASDIQALFYDAAFDVWGNKKQLTSDAEVEANIATAFYGGNLVAVYNRTAAPEPAPLTQSSKTPAASGATQQPAALTDLFMLTHVVGGDLAVKANTLQASPGNPRPGEMTTLSATMVNQGDVAVRDVPVNFHQGDPAAGGTLIGTATVSATLAPGGEALVSVPWTLASTAAPLSVYVTVDPAQAFDDANRANNTAVRRMVRPDLTIQSMTWERQAGSAVLVTARVLNAGSLPSTPTAVTFRLNSPTGAVIGSPALGALNPDGSADVSVVWNAAGLGAAQYLISAAADEGNTVEEYDDANNAATLVVSLNSAELALDGVAPAAGLAAGGQQLRLTGSFAELSAVSVGGTNAAWTYTNGTGEITVTTPAHAVGAVAIELTSSAGTTLRRENAFAYLPTTFTDDPLVAGVTEARAQHVLELRAAVDALRAVAGLGAATWSDATMSPRSTVIKAAHIDELRRHLEEAAARLGMPAASYTDATLGAGTFVKRVHIEELRQRIRALAG